MTSRILLVTTNFWPEPTGSAVYATDLANSLNENGFEVTILTSLPHYPWWRVPAEFAHLGEGESTYNGVRVVRAKHLVPPTMNAIQRMRFELSLWWNLRRVSKRFEAGKFDAVIAYIPTVAAGIIGKKLATKFRIPYGLIIQDLSGAGAKQSGIKGGALISFVAKAVEGRALFAADSIAVVSPAMPDVLVGLGVNRGQITQILNYSANLIEYVDRSEARERFGWSPDAFIVLHTGNMGAKQDLENVVNAAVELSTHAEIQFYLVGHGNQEAKLTLLCSNLENINVLSAVSDADYSAVLAAADLLLVNERATQMEMSLPSKLTSYLFSRRPVLAAVPRGGATWKFLEGFAVLVEAGKPSELAKAIVEIKGNPNERIRLSGVGLDFAQKNLSVESGRKNYLNWVRKLLTVSV